MSIWRLVTGLIMLSTGLVLAGMAIYDARYWAAAAYFIAGISSAISVVVWEAGISTLSLTPTVIAIVFTIISVIDVFSSSHVLKQEEAKAQMDFFEIILQLHTDPSGLDEDERSLAGKAFFACGMQSNRDFLDLTMNANKALRLGPNATLVDGVDSAFNPAKSARCLDYFDELYKTQPMLFLNFVKKYPWLLNKDKV
ncbi:hypothetical protein [Pseudomonas syringae pv. coryli]|uniref:Uncharacterized protein n=1 Tax=Pseudomonas syringae pv. coryli TaxID=317659 RepID=A0A0N8R4M1_9PSED|nr:hypothetical protein [Pseudomonas syringae pv. coryli]KPW92774.1 Unknown protein sequence [Pseudomonas syringae pv. coryli]